MNLLIKVCMALALVSIAVGTVGEQFDNKPVKIGGQYAATGFLSVVVGSFFFDKKL